MSFPRAQSITETHPWLFVEERQLIGQRVRAQLSFGQGSRCGRVDRIEYSRSTGAVLYVLADGGRFTRDELTLR